MASDVVCRQYFWLNQQFRFIGSVVSDVRVQKRQEADEINRSVHYRGRGQEVHDEGVQVEDEFVRHDRSRFDFLRLVQDNPAEDVSGIWMKLLQLFFGHFFLVVVILVFGATKHFDRRRHPVLVASIEGPLDPCGVRREDDVAESDRVVRETPNSTEQIGYIRVQNAIAVLDGDFYFVSQEQPQGKSK